MNDKRYPPVEIRPGEVKELMWADGVVELVGLDDEKVTVFVIAYAEWRHLTAIGAMVTQEQRHKAAREANAAFNALPNRIKQIVTERTKGRVIV